MKIQPADKFEWRFAGYARGERAVLRTAPGGGRTSILRLKAGAKSPRHRHEVGEDVLVLSGKITLGGVLMGAGDYAWTDAGEEHDLIAVEDAMVYVASERPIHVVEEPPGSP